MQSNYAVPVCWFSCTECKCEVCSDAQTKPSSHHKNQPLISVTERFFFPPALRVCVCKFVCMRVWVKTCACVNVLKRVYACMCELVCMSVYENSCTCMYVWIHKNACVYLTCITVYSCIVRRQRVYHRYISIIHHLQINHVRCVFYHLPFGSLHTYTSSHMCTCSHA